MTTHSPAANIGNLPPKALRELTVFFEAEEEKLRQGGGPAGQERQKALGRLTARERIARLLDEPARFLELQLWAAHKMYPDWGDVPAAGTVAVIGRIHGRPCLVVANDATVKAGAFFPQTCKKVLRAQRIGGACRLPIIYLVDSAGVFLPLQEDVFPDEDDFGRVFRNNAILSANKVPQIAAIMGNCVAGGAYLPVLCDKVLMTEGSALYLAGPALVKAAIGQKVEAEELGGATMHAEIAGTIDFHERDDETCLARIRSLIDLLPASAANEVTATKPDREPAGVYDIVSSDGRKEYDMRDLLACIVDAGSLQESKAEFGRTLITAYAKIGGRPTGIVANQRHRVQSSRGELQLGGVLYGDSAEKAAEFVQDCDRVGLPILFIQDVQGFMVGRDAEQSGIIRQGAKLVHAVSTARCPKITVIVGGSFGAGHYVLCGKAFDPTFIFAWPNARYAVMGADQAAETLLAVRQKNAERHGKKLTADEVRELRESIRNDYLEQTDIRYGAARGWVDAIIAPHSTRDVLIDVLTFVSNFVPEPAAV